MEPAIREYAVESSILLHPILVIVPFILIVRRGGMWCPPLTASIEQVPEEEKCVWLKVLLQV